MSQTEDTAKIAPASSIWLLVDHSTRAMAFGDVADVLEQTGHSVEVVTMTEAIGTMARDMFTGSAERVLRGLRVAIQGNSDEDLIGAVRRVKPDVLVVTNPRHTRALSLLEGLAKTPMLQVGVLPDYNLSQAWLKSGLEAFIVPHEELRDRLERAHVPSARIFIAGPAVEPAFSRPLEREAIRKEFGFSHKEHIVLVRAEALDVTTLEKVVFQAKLVEGSVRYIFHHNGDGTAASALRRAASEYGLPAVMFGRVEDLERYISMADMVLTVAHDPLMPEIMALGLPVMMVGGVEGAAEQAEFLERHSMGRLVPDVLRLGSELERFLLPDVLDKYSAAARAIGLPEGSREVADALLDLIARSASWHGEQASSHADSSSEDQDEASSHSAFESIGNSGAQDTSSARDAHTGRSAGDQAAPAPSYVGISRAEAKEQLAQLILAERDLERRLTALEKEQERWRSRLDLARQWNEEDLASEAEEILRGYLDEARPLQQELQGLRTQKAKLKAAAGEGAGSSTSTSSSGPADGLRSGRRREVEGRFRRMEENRDLDDLKDRINREFDD